MVYRLQKYKGKSSRTSCPSCGGRHEFALYVDGAGNRIDDRVGRCNNEIKCGYHLPPAEFFANNGDIAVPPAVPFKEEEEVLHYMDAALVEKALDKRQKSVLVNFLCTTFSNEKALPVLANFAVGISKKWSGSTVFWYVDVDNNVRTGKIMGYNGNGKRVKEPFPQITWVHSLLKLEGNYSACLYGEHLLPIFRGKIVNIVESEKTALIMNIVKNKGEWDVENWGELWLAVGGISQINYKKMSVLEGFQIIFHPDSGGIAIWRQKMNMLRERGMQCSISYAMEKYETGCDVADIILKKN